MPPCGYGIETPEALTKPPLAGPMDAQTIAQLIADHSRGSSKSDGSGGFFAPCPCHDDRTASLHIKRGRNSGVVLHCHAGCTTLSIIAAAGLSWRDLFTDPTSGAQTPSAEYVYLDSDDRYGYTIWRYGNGKGKRFKACSINAAGDLVLNARGVARVLYHAPEVAKAVATGEPIYLCEGEKDVDAMVRAYGVVATTNAFGALSWAKDAQLYDYAEPLRNAQVVVVQDRDATGRRRTKQILASLRGVAASLRVIEAAAGKDAFDHIAAGKALSEFVELAEAAYTLADDGTFVALPTAFFEAAGACNLSHLDYRVLVELARQTVRRESKQPVWQSRLLPSTWLARCSGNASPSYVRGVLDRLQEADILIANQRPGMPSELRVNGDFSAWRPLPSQPKRSQS
jgi:hypothetical protein